jgi:hypothetical protein
MALAHINLANTDSTLVYTCPASKRAVLSVSMCNRNIGSVALYLALTANSVSNTDYLEYGAVCGGSGVLERSGLLLVAGDKLYAQTATSNVSVVVYGIEESV